MIGDKNFDSQTTDGSARCCMHRLPPHACPNRTCLAMPCYTTVIHDTGVLVRPIYPMKRSSALRRSALSVCPCGNPWGTPLQSEIRDSWTPVKPPRGQTLRSPRPKVYGVYGQRPAPRGSLRRVRGAAKPAGERGLSARAWPAAGACARGTAPGPSTLNFVN